MIHVALVSAYPTEADARRALITMPGAETYLGTWLAPTHESVGERPEVHAFSDEHDADDLLRMGWIRP